MQKLLIFPFNLLAHYTRCLVLADSLKDDYEVYFQDSHKYNHLVEKRGYKTFACETFDDNKVMKDIQHFKFSWLNEPDLERIFSSQKAVISKLNPTLVIGDVIPTLKMVCEQENVKYISLVNGYTTKYYQGRRTLPNKSLLFQLLNKTPIQFNHFGEFLFNWKIHLPFKKIRKKNELQKQLEYRNELEGDETWICDDPTLFPQINLPEKYKIIGPLLYASAYTQKAISTNKKAIITVCMGSSGNWSQLKFLESSSFKNYHVIACGVGNQVLNANHIQNEDFVDLDAVLPSTELLICHGGNGTVYKGIQHKVKMLFLTHHFEQEWNVQQFTKHNFGKDLTPLMMEERKKETLQLIEKQQ